MTRGTTIGILGIIGIIINHPQMVNGIKAGWQVSSSNGGNGIGSSTYSSILGVRHPLVAVLRVHVELHP